MRLTTQFPGEFSEMPTITLCKHMTKARAEMGFGIELRGTTEVRT